MAQKRMFNNSVVGSDEFLEMPDSSQNLYFHLSMQADDDGFVDNWKSIMRMTGKKEDDLKILIMKSFIIPFDTGVLVIRHWRLNNYIRTDRYKETVYKTEKSLLSTDSNLVYQMDTSGIPLVDADKIRVDKSSIDKSSCSSNNIKSVSCVNDSGINDSCVNGLSATTANDSRVDDLQKVIDFYNNNICLATAYTLDVFIDYLKEMPADLLILAMKKAVEANIRNIKYIKGILNSWSKKGIKTVLEAENEDYKFKNKTVNQEETEEEILARRARELEEAIKSDNQ